MTNNDREREMKEKEALRPYNMCRWIGACELVSETTEERERQKERHREREREEEK